MKKLDDRTMANLEIVLEESCRCLPHGGSHAFRKKVAQKLLNSARKGNVTLSGLAAVAHTAISEAMNRKSA